MQTQKICPCFSLFFFTFIFLNNWIDASKPKMHCITVSSHKTEKMQPLLESAQKQKISLKILGLNQPYPGNGQKLILIKEFLHSIPQEDVVLFLDAYDTLFLNNTKTILAKFLSFNSPLIVSAEKVCFPLRYLAKHYPPTISPFKYLNSGAFIGYAGFILKILEEIPINAAFSDQAQLSNYFIEHNFPFMLDHFAELFLNLFGVEEDEVLIDEEHQSLYCKTTNSTPSILHANGKSFGAVYQQAYLMLCTD